MLVASLSIGVGLAARPVAAQPPPENEPNEVEGELDPPPDQDDSSTGDAADPDEGDEAASDTPDRTETEAEPDSGSESEVELEDPSNDDVDTDEPAGGEPPDLSVRDLPRVAEDQPPPTPDPTDDVDPLLDVDAIEEVSLEELLGTTVTATGTEMTLQEAPSVVEVISHRDIRRRGYRTVADALQHVAGLHLVDDHLYQNAGVRGIFAATGSPNDIIQVMINGQPVMFRPTSGNFLGFELIPIAAVDRIEVLRGPASALYGANAFLGVINIITFQGADSELGRRPAHSVAGDFYAMQTPTDNTLNGSASFLTSGSKGGFDFLLAGTVHRADRSGLVVPGVQDLIRDAAFRSDPDRFDAPRGFPSPGFDSSARQFLFENPVSRNDIERTASFYGIGTHHFSDTASLSLDANLQYSDRNAEWQDFTFLTHETRMTHANGYARLRAQLGRFEPGEFAGEVSIALSHGQPTRKERIRDRLVAGRLQRRRLSSTAIDVLAQGDYTFAERSSFRLGFDYAHDLEDLLTIESINEATGAVTDDGGLGERTFYNIGAYTQLTWNPWDRLQITLGARVDHNSQIACNSPVRLCLGDLGDRTVVGPAGESITIEERGALQLSGRGAIVYEFPWSGLYAKLIYGSAYKPPSPFQLYRNRLTISGSSLGNPTLKPQTANTVEAQIGIRPVEGLHISAVVFSTWVEDVVLFLVEEGRLVGRNADVTVQGLELSARYDTDHVVSFFANGGFLLRSEVRPQQRSDETDFAWRTSPFNTAAPVGRYPDITANLGINLAFAHINVNASAGVIGRRRASLVNNQLLNRDLNETYELPAYVTADLTVSSVGLHLFGQRETVLSLSIRGAPGGYVEAGGGGVDIPSLGTRIHVAIRQEL